MTLPSAAAMLSTPRILLVIGGIYTTQSTVGALTFQGMPAVLRAAGTGLDVIGLIWLLMLPWTLKILWATPVERWRRPAGGGRRSRRLILGGQAATLAVLAAAALAAPAQAPVQTFVLLGVAAVLAATVDIACDAFAIEQLRPAQRSWGNVMQVGGGYLGMMIGGGAFLVLIDAWGWSAALPVLIAVLAVLTLPMAVTREPAPEAAASATARRRPTMAAALARPAMRRGLLVVLVAQCGLRLVQGLLGPVMIDQGMDLATIGWLLGGAGTAASLAGTLLAGVAVRHLGAVTVLRLGLGAQAVAFAGLLGVVLVPALPTTPLLVLAPAFALSTAVSFVALYTLMMGWAASPQPGVDFTLLQCADAAVAMVAGLGAGVAAQYLGYGACLAAATGAVMIGAAILPRLAAPR